MSNQADFLPLNPAYAERVRDSFARQGAMALIGAALSRLGPPREGGPGVPRP